MEIRANPNVENSSALSILGKDIKGGLSLVISSPFLLGSQRVGVPVLCSFRLRESQWRFKDWMCKGRLSCGVNSGYAFDQGHVPANWDNTYKT